VLLALGIWLIGIVAMNKEANVTQEEKKKPLCCCMMVRAILSVSRHIIHLLFILLSFFCLLYLRPIICKPNSMSRIISRRERENLFYHHRHIRPLSLLVYARLEER